MYHSFVTIRSVRIDVRQVVMLARFVTAMDNRQEEESLCTLLQEILQYHCPCFSLQASLQPLYQRQPKKQVMISSNLETNDLLRPCRVRVFIQSERSFQILLGWFSGISTVSNLKRVIFSDSIGELVLWYLQYKMTTCFSLHVVI